MASLSQVENQSKLLVIDLRVETTRHVGEQNGIDQNACNACTFYVETFLSYRRTCFEESTANKVCRFRPGFASRSAILTLVPSARAVHDLHSKSGISSTGSVDREGPIPIALCPSGDGCGRCYENCELPLAISRVRGVLRAVKE